MTEDKTIEILKNAILLEKRGHAFYREIAQQTSGAAVREFFNMMADEEVKHIKILADQFKSYQANQKFVAGELDESQFNEIASKVLTQAFKKEISAADYEAAAISAAMSMEEKAIELYSDRAKQTQDPNEQGLYDWLARWEMEHLKFLAQIDKELKEEVWNDASFWPL
jgi:rubrerythrin